MKKSVCWKNDLIETMVCGTQESKHQVVIIAGFAQ